MRYDAYLVWGWSPQYLLASRWEPPADRARRVEHERAVPIIEDLARSDPAALRATWVSAGMLEAQQVQMMSSEQLCHRLRDELERPTGRLGLYERHTSGGLGQLASDLDAEITDLIALAGDDSDQD